MPQLRKVLVVACAGLAGLFACSTQTEVQDQFTSDSNYFDYQYYQDDISHLDTFEERYNYPLQAQEEEEEEFEHFGNPPAPPVYLPEQQEETRNGSDWFFEDY